MRQAREGTFVYLAPAALSIVAQVEPGGNVPVGESLFGGAVTAFFSTLVVAGILVLVVPDYVERMMDEVVDDPLTNFLAGFLSFAVIIVGIVILAITIVGLLLAIPLGLLLWLLWAVGGAIAYLAIADRIVDRDGDWTVPVLLAAGISGVLALTGIGGLLSLVIGAVGFGAVLRDLL